MKNDFCDLDETQLRDMEIPPLATGLLTSPFQHNVRDGWVCVPADTFKQFTDCVADYVVLHNIAKRWSGGVAARGIATGERLTGIASPLLFILALITNYLRKMETETLDKLYLEISQRTKARTRRETQALDVLKRVWLKLNCGIDNEPDSAIADAAWDCICNDMGCDEAVAWSEKEVPDED